MEEVVECSGGPTPHMPAKLASLLQKKKSLRLAKEGKTVNKGDEMAPRFDIVLPDEEEQYEILVESAGLATALPTDQGAAETNPTRLHRNHSGTLVASERGVADAPPRRSGPPLWKSGRGVPSDPWASAQQSRRPGVCNSSVDADDGSTLGSRAENKTRESGLAHHLVDEFRSNSKIIEDAKRDLSISRSPIGIAGRGGSFYKWRTQKQPGKALSPILESPI
ncbi:hypothetical protein FVE85_4499 [Porphyridium purpureum]|uniref:Uncharacterized protein n=1 Tax=Porphyridium purpureum TaxID=35688 RepID=A0A5J4YJ51_PORPP|nr:hypothetical protein FVE85_4499 [Porphyridium purpureum]|eukprot:POR9822..scf297_16